MRCTTHAQTSPEDMARAVEALRAGGLVVFPTETVYGVGGDASNPDALKRIFEVKGRPVDHPLIVHLARASQIEQWARDIPPHAWLVAERFWPGPLTIILKRAPGVHTLVTGDQDTVGLRVPGHPVAHALLEAFGVGVCAPSANRFGRISPTTAAHALDELGDAVDVVLDGGPCALGVESTILDLSGDMPRLLRPGSIAPSDLAELLGEPCETPEPGGPRASGGLPSHYAPRTPLQLVPEARLSSTVTAVAETGAGFAVMAIGPPSHELPEGCVWVTMPPNPADYARALYARLRQLDAGGYDLILAELPPRGEQWLAVHDRLGRAAAHRP